MGTLYQILILVVLVTLADAMNPETEKLLTGLGNSEISVFATTTGTVDHMEPDQYKPGFVIFNDHNSLSTSNGIITEAIAGNSTEYGYKEGIGSAARFRTINGLTQISSTQIIVLDRNNYCLRQVDRVTSLTSVFAGQCESSGYQDGVSAKFRNPRAVIVDKKDSTQLIVAEGNVAGIYHKGALRTVNLASKLVGTLTTSSDFAAVTDMVQDGTTGDIYITIKSDLYQVSYITKSLNRRSTDEQDDRKFRGLYMLEDGKLLIANYGENNLLLYRTDVKVLSKLKICENFKKAYIQSGSECVIDSPYSILIVKNQLLVGIGGRIISYKPKSTLSDKPSNIPETASIPAELKPTASAMVPLSSSCNPRNITVYKDPNAKTIEIELGEGYNINLSEGIYTYKTPASLNGTCTTTVRVVDNVTDVPTKPLTCPNDLVAITSPDRGSLSICHQVIGSDMQYYQIRHTLELVADYTVDCSVVNSTVTWSLLRDVAQQKYTIIEALCGSDCKRPHDSAKPVLSCENRDDLKIRWSTDLVFTADIVSVPTSIREALVRRIRTRGVTLNVVVFGAQPPIVYPKKAANGGYISIALSTSCTNGLTYSDVKNKCLPK